MKVLYGVTAVPIVFLGLGLLVERVVCWTQAVPYHRGPTTERFDGQTFQNQEVVPRTTAREIVHALMHRNPGPWRSSTPRTDEASYAPPPPRVGPGELRVTFINHSTVLIQMDGVNLLADPIWSERASPVSWGPPKRVRPPGIPFDRLPPIDVVLVSHNHYDHMDLPTLRGLVAAHHPRILVPLGNRAFLEREGITGAQDLDWWESVVVGQSVRAWAVPAQHGSGRALCDQGRALWAGFVIVGSAGPVYFGGDTAFGPHFAQIKERFGPIRLALLPIGAFRPPSIMSRVHMSPDEAVEAHQVLSAETSVAIHFGTFPMADDGEDEPLARLRAALGRVPGPPPRFWVLGFGEGRHLEPLSVGPT